MLPVHFSCSGDEPLSIDWSAGLTASDSITPMTAVLGPFPGYADTWVVHFPSGRARSFGSWAGAQMAALAVEKHVLGVADERAYKQRIGVLHERLHGGFHRLSAIEQRDVFDFLRQPSPTRAQALEAIEEARTAQGQRSEATANGSARMAALVG